MLCSNVENAVSSPSQKIILLLFQHRYDEATALLRAELEFVSGDASLLSQLRGGLNAKAEELGRGPKAKRQILAGSYMLAEILREQEYWHEAEAIYDEVVATSLAMNEPFFLRSAQVLRAVCLKHLGRTREFLNAKAQVPPGTTILLDGYSLRIEDL